MTNADNGGSEEPAGPPSSAAGAPPTEPAAKNAFICGIVSVVLALFLPLLGIIMAVVTFVLIPKAEQKIAASNGALGGEAQLRSARIAAITAIVIAVVNFVVAIVIIAN